MISYALKCPQDHRFESWFQSSAAFDRLLATGMLACPACGATQITKAVMAPRLSAACAHPSPDGARRGCDVDKDEGQSADQAPGPLHDTRQSAADTAKEAAVRTAIAELKARIETTSDYVGTEFTREARAIHLGEAPERPIHGEARLEDAKALIKEGVPVAPLPFIPGRKLN